MEGLLLFLLALVGVIAGASSGLLGIGGGIVMVPALMAWAGLSFFEAVSTSLVVMVLVTPIGVWRHRRAGNVRLGPGLLLGAGGVAGVAVATATQHLVPVRAFLVLFSAVLVLGAHDVVHRTAPGRRARARRPGAWVLVPMGFLAGVVAKWLGIGGGILMVPMLAVQGLGIHAAVGTSLVAVWTNAVVATGINLATGWGLWPLAAALAVGSFLGIQAGSLAAIRARADVLGRVFAGALLLAALYMGARAA